MKHKRLVVFVALCLLVAGTSFGAVVGKISGVVTSAQTKEPLMGVSVLIVGTTMGGMTDTNGVYNINNVPAGTYTLKMSSVGFSDLEISNVEVTADLTTYQNQALTVRAVEGKVVKVTAERPLVVKDRTNNISIVKADEIQALPTRGFDQVVGIQNGVVKINSNPVVRVRGGRESVNTSELNLRGGRPSEVAYYVDGFSQQDPLSGNSTANISNNAIQEVTIQTGGFPAEYGNVASGIVNTITSSGTKSYHGSMELVSDNAGSWLGQISNKIKYSSYDNNFYSADIGGPVPGIDKATFFFSGERRWKADRSPSSHTDVSLPGSPNILPNNWQDGWSYQGKVIVGFTPNFKLELSGNGSDDKWSEYRHDYLFDIAHTPYYRDQNLGLNAKITHTLNAKTFYNLSGSYFKTYRFRGDGVYRENLWGYARPNGNYTYDKEALFWHGDSAATTPVFVTDTVDGVARTFMSTGDEGSVWDDYLKRKSSYIGIKGDINSQIDANNTVKAGFEFQRHTLRYYRNLYPSLAYGGVANGFAEVDRYGYDIYGNETDTSGEGNATKHPINMAAYLQDRLEWRGMIVNAGMHFDYFDYKTKRLKNLANPMDPDLKGNADPLSTVLDATDLEPSKKFTRLSPRLGVAFPVSDRTQLHVNFGKFFQRPDLNRLYVGYDYFEHKVKTGGYYYAIGNPNLEPEKTTQYEIGISHQLGENTALDVSTFYKDISGLVQVYSQAAKPNSYSLYRNSDYGNVRGVELHMHIRRTRNLELDFKYTLSYATGTGSYANTQQNVAWTGSPAPKQTAALDYDQRHNLVGDLDFKTGKSEGPRIGDIFPLENFGLNVVAQLASGTPYSSAEVYNEITLNSVQPVLSAPRNSAYGPFTLVIDLKMERSFTVGSFKIKPYVWVKNLLNRDNAISVYESTGRPNTTGWLLTNAGRTFIQSNNTADQTGYNGEEKYNIKADNPQNYSNPRMVFFGVTASF